MFLNYLPRKIFGRFGRIVKSELGGKRFNWLESFLLMAALLVTWVFMYFLDSLKEEE